MAKQFGHAAGSAPASKPADPSTSEGLLRISREQGWVEAMTASAEYAMRTGIKQKVQLVDGDHAPPYVRLERDKPTDPRTRKQRDADYDARNHHKETTMKFAKKLHRPTDENPKQLDRPFKLAVNVTDNSFLECGTDSKRPPSGHRWATLADIAGTEYEPVS